MQSQGAKHIHTHQGYQNSFNGPPIPPHVYDICGKPEIITVGCAREVCVTFQRQRDILCINQPLHSANKRSCLHINQGLLNKGHDRTKYNW